MTPLLSFPPSVENPDLFDVHIGEFIDDCFSTTESDNTPLLNESDASVSASWDPFHMEQTATLTISSANLEKMVTHVPSLHVANPLLELGSLPPSGPITVPSSTAWPHLELSSVGSSPCEGRYLEQKVERRKRNREHAKKSRMRKKQFVDELQISVAILKDENERLRAFIRQRLGDSEADRVLNPENLQKIRVERGVVHSARALLNNKTLTLRLPEENIQNHLTIRVLR